MKTDPPTIKKTSIAQSIKPNKKIVRGYRAEDIMLKSTFPDVIYLLLYGRLPSKNESRMFEVLLVTHCTGTYDSSASMAARYIISSNPDQHAAVAGGLLAMGFYHAGATEECADLARAGVRRMKVENRTPAEMARIIVDEYMKEGKRIPGIGNSFEGIDPRVKAQLQAAKELGFHGEHLNLYLEIEGAFPRKKPTHIINPEATGAAIMLDMLGQEFDTRSTDLWHLIARLPSVAAAVLEEQQRVGRRQRFEPSIYDGPSERDLPEEYLSWREQRVFAQA
jgi:citrate synthase